MARPLNQSIISADQEGGRGRLTWVEKDIPADLLVDSGAVRRSRKGKRRQKVSYGPAAEVGAEGVDAGLVEADGTVAAVEAEEQLEGCYLGTSVHREVVVDPGQRGRQL